MFRSLTYNLANAIIRRHAISLMDLIYMMHITDFRRFGGFYNSFLKLLYTFTILIEYTNLNKLTK